MKGWRDREIDGGNLKDALQGCNMPKKTIFT
jgi:hypothetical protein